MGDVTATTAVVVSACLLLWGLISARMERLHISAPIAFVLFGFLTNNPPLALIHLGLHSTSVRLLAELALALVLFGDASRVNARNLLMDAALPGRLLGVGLPLTIALGAAIASVVLNPSSLWIAGLIAAIVAPTDAALGLPIVRDKRVPIRIRRLLNVESGLNDGIATPFVNLFIAGAVSSETTRSAGLGRAITALLLGLAIGFAIGSGAALVGHLAHVRGWSLAGFQPLATFAVPILTYSAALALGGNGFVAAFVCGMAYGTFRSADETSTVGLTDDIGDLLSLIVWFLFGATMLVPAFADSSWRDLVFALLALTIVRIVPVAVALLGSGLDRATVLFIGWFGPRGLASIVFALIAVDSLDAAGGKLVLSAATLTILISVLAHGISAAPLARRYGMHAAALSQDRSEHMTLAPLPDHAIAGHRRHSA